jgi:hypothetical protein
MVGWQGGREVESLWRLRFDFRVKHRANKGALVFIARAGPIARAPEATSLSDDALAQLLRVLKAEGLV